MSDNTVKYSIQIVDQFGKVIEKFDKGIDSATEKVSKLDKTINKFKKDPFNTQKKSLAELRENVKRYQTAAENSFRLDHIKKYNRLIEETQKKIKGIEDAAKTCQQRTEDMFDEKGGFFAKLKDNFGITKGLLGVGAIAGASSKAFDYGKESIAAAAQIEKYEVTLKNYLGTTDAARERMQEYFDIAKQTPFDLPQVVEAGNKLQALGRYTRENVTMLGDLAAASGKPMEQALSAYAKMASGQKGIAVDMFRDLMITVDDWTAATGKGVSKNGELLATTNELIAALPGIMKSKGYLGMMATQAGTTEGKVSNLEDAYFQLKVAVGDRMKPAYTSFIENTSKAVEKMQRWVEIPIEQKIAAEKAELNALVGSLINAADNEERRKDIIETLQTKYPEFIKNIDLEKASTSELRKELEKTNSEYDKKMRKAAYQRQIDALETEMGETMDDISKYEVSIEAKKQANKIRKEEEDLLKTILGDQINDTGGSYSIGMDGKVMFTPSVSFSYGPSLPQNTATKMTEEQRQKAIQIYAEKEANKKLINFWGGDERKLENAQKDYEIYQNQRELLQSMMEGDDASNLKQKREQLLAQAQGINTNDTDTYQKLFGSKKLKNEFLEIVKSAGEGFNEVTDEQWDRLSGFMSGSLVYKRPTTNPTPEGYGIRLDDKLSGAEGTITGGGRGVKNIVINVDSLIGINNNNFEQGETPQDKIDFQNKLHATLMSILNDANKIA